MNLEIIFKNKSKLKVEKIKIKSKVERVKKWSKSMNLEIICKKICKKNKYIN